MPQTNFGSSQLRLAVRLALGGGTIAASFGVANAQVATATTAPADTTLSEVVVTGSRIAAPNALSISPVTFVSSVDIQQTGITQVADLLNQLPQVFADQGSNIINGGLGTETVNLRGLNTKRTLVLVNGFRLGYGDPRSGGAGSDINQIPAALIDSIEVLTGGASSTYGADAVAGVVNFKLNDHFEGVKLVANAGIYNHSNNNNQNVETDLNNYNTSTGNSFPAAPHDTTGGATQELTFLAGLNSPDGNGNATVYASYRKIAAVLQSKYSYGACNFGSGYNSPTAAGQFGCTGSGTSYPGRFFFAGTPSSDSTIGPGGTLVPFTNANRFNFGPLNYYMAPDTHYTAGAFLHYEFNEHATVYSQTMFMNDRQVLQIAPSGAFFGNPYSTNCSNPYLSASELTAWCGGSTAGMTSGLYIGRRNVEGGNRQDDVEHTDWREVIGVKGKIDDAWDYDANFQYGIVNLSDAYLNDVSSTKVNYALNVVSVGGVPTCAVNVPTPVSSGLGLGCVPWNIFQPGGVTKAATNYINTPGIQTGQITQTVVSGYLNGDFGKYGMKLPTASSGLKVNIGAEWRDVYSVNTPDAEFANGDLAGQGGARPGVQGGIISREGFFEARLPLVEDMAFTKALDVETGYRYSNYSLGFKTNTYKFGVDWAPVSDVRFRGSFQRAVRAPNVVELFAPQSVNLDGNTDPCAGTTPTYSPAACARTGVTTAQYGHILANSAAQYNGLTGGNPVLAPETALTTSFGIQFTPTFLPNFRMNVDYFDIKIENVIETIGADTILKECLTADQFCNDIHRNNLGSLWIGTTGYVVDALANVGKLEEKGVDLDLAYTLDMAAMGKLHFGVSGTYLNAYTVTPLAATGANYNCAGLYGLACSSVSAGAGTPAYRWRDTFRTTWTTPWSGVDVSVAWRYFSSVKLEQLSGNPLIAAAAGATIANGGISNTDSHIASYSYIDLTAGVKLADKVTVRVGVNNLLDKSPPVIGSNNLPGTSGNGNTFPQVYDALGRFLFGQVIVQF
jgi:iron complex outermembrane recepter protein